MIAKISSQDLMVGIITQARNLLDVAARLRGAWTLNAQMTILAKLTLLLSYDRRP